MAGLPLALFVTAVQRAFQGRWARHGLRPILHTTGRVRAPAPAAAYAVARRARRRASTQVQLRPALSAFGLVSCGEQKPCSSAGQTRRCVAPHTHMCLAPTDCDPRLADDIGGALRGLQHVEGPVFSLLLRARAWAAEENVGPGEPAPDPQRAEAHPGDAAFCGHVAETSRGVVVSSGAGSRGREVHIITSG